MHESMMHSKRSAMVVTGLALFSGCSRDSQGSIETSTLLRPGASAECPIPQVQNLGRPFRGSKTVAKFTTDGNPLVISASDFEKSGWVTSGKRRTEVDIGPDTSPPSYDELTGIVTGATSHVSVEEGALVQVQLPAGRYWIWSTNSAALQLHSCTPANPTAIEPSFPG